MSQSLPKGFFLMRGERLYGLSGWWPNVGAALRFNSREEAQTAIQEMRLLGDVQITERPYQPLPLPRPDTADYDPFGMPT